MGRKVDVDELVGAAEIASRLDVDRRVVHQWRQRHEAFPQPVATVTNTLIWEWSAVARWARSTGRLA